MVNKGFTLIEVMIVVVIIAILAAIAYPSYTKYKVRTNRADVQAEMMRIAQNLQNYKLVNHIYTGAKLDNNTVTEDYPISGTAFYTINLYFSGDTYDHDNDNKTPGKSRLDVGDSSWQLEAVPIDGTIQEDNGTVKLNDLVQKCWTITTIVTPAAPPKPAVKSLPCTLSATSNWDGR